MIIEWRIDVTVNPEGLPAVPSAGKPVGRGDMMDSALSRDVLIAKLQSSQGISELTSPYSFLVFSFRQCYEPHGRQ